MTWQTERDSNAAQHASLLASHLAPSMATLNGVATEIIKQLPPDAGEAKAMAHKRLQAELHNADRRKIVEDLWQEYSGLDDLTPERKPPAQSEEGVGERVGRRMRYLSASPAWVALGLVSWTLVVYVLLVGGWPYVAQHRVDVLTAFAVVGLTLLPAFLYLRFVRFRLDPVCEEYVFNLHRLKVDRDRNLPRPPRTSEAWQRWVEDGGYLRAREGRNVYEQKFRTHYGRWPTRTLHAGTAGEGQDGSHWYAESLGNLTAIYGCTALVGAGWASVVWTLPASLEPPGPPLADVLRFGFLGAYFYVVSTLMRRFFQNDLRPGAYLAAIIRFVTVLVLLVAVHQVLEAMSAAPATEYSIAFLIGVFPTVGMQLLRKSASAVTGIIRGGIEPPMPLRQLDGMDIWTEARMLEVGIEDVQHLATANFVDTLLATRIPAQRLVDWVDQSLLLCRAGLPGFPNTEWKRGSGETSTYQQLRCIGVRTASDLGYFFESLKHRAAHLADVAATDSLLKPLATSADNSASLLCRAAMINLSLCNDPNLRLIKNWQSYEQNPQPGPIAYW